MDGAVDTITVVWYNHHTHQCGVNPHVDSRLAMIPGSIFVDSDANRYVVTYYNDPHKVAFCMLKEG